MSNRSSGKGRTSRGSSKSPNGRQVSVKDQQAQNAEMSRLDNLQMYLAASSLFIFLTMLALSFKFNMAFGYPAYPITLKTPGLGASYRRMPWHARGKGDATCAITYTLWFSATVYCIQRYLESYKPKTVLTIPQYVKFKYIPIQILFHLFCFIAWTIAIISVPCGIKDVLQGYPEHALPLLVKAVFFVMTGYWLSCIMMTFIYASSPLSDDFETAEFGLEAVCTTAVLVVAYFIPSMTPAVIYPLAYRSIVRLIGRVTEMLAMFGAPQDPCFLLSGLHYILMIMEKLGWIAYSSYITAKSLNASDVAFKATITAVIIGSVLVQFVLGIISNKNETYKHPGGFTAGFLGFPTLGKVSKPSKSRQSVR